VPECVVDLLESVEVEHQESGAARRRAVRQPAQMATTLVQPVPQPGAIRETGKRIEACCGEIALGGTVSPSAVPHRAG